MSSDEKAKLPVTAVIPVRNEEVNLLTCLEALGEFAHITVIDSSSTDRTADIVKMHGAEYVNFQWNGRYPKKRNWLLMNNPPKTPWVLFVDADEVVTSAFCEELRRTLPGTGHNGFWLRYTNYFLGRALRHGVPQRKLALFRVGSGLYERIDEDAWSRLDMEVHEHPRIEGTIGEIESPVDHRDFRGLAKFLERHIEYAKWEAGRLLLLQNENSDAGKHLTPRQKFKYANVEKFWYPWFYFIYAYVVRLGLLDGSAGFKYAFYKAWYFFTVRLVLQEQRNTEHSEASSSK
jgi:glycosyltransferase involved in cell wall biosynthesis